VDEGDARHAAIPMPDSKIPVEALMEAGYGKLFFLPGNTSSNSISQAEITKKSMETNKTSSGIQNRPGIAVLGTRTRPDISVLRIQTRPDISVLGVQGHVRMAPNADYFSSMFVRALSLRSSLQLLL
jgi:hypothetical protein